MRVGFGYDSHRLLTGRKFILGGLDIPYEKGPSGHSDADVLVHAICDALLGAIGEGDIGILYPDSDPRYKDISSLKILQRVMGMVSDKGFSIHNVDSTVILEKPKIAGYVPTMADRLAPILGISPGMISIKAKTNETMGLIGQGEGIAAFAVITVEETFAK
jgi:2-C-methyl-D-erythritol 2,4-cyclodiphosphate synthase